MNGQDQAQPAGVRAVNFTSRTPADVAAQLERDAGSLTLTGQSFEKDKHFYDQVAANIREAAVLLAQWQPLLEKLEAGAAQRELNAAVGAFCRSQEIATRVAGLVPNRSGGAATTWRICGLAINEAIQAVRDNPPAPPPVSDAAALATYRQRIAALVRT